MPKSTNITLDIRTDITGIGVRVPLGSGAVMAPYGAMDLSVGANRDTLSLGYLHTLSRRTELYAVTMRDQLDGQSNGGGQLPWSD